MLFVGPTRRRVAIAETRTGSPTQHRPLRTADPELVEDVAAQAEGGNERAHATDRRLALARDDGVRREREQPWVGQILGRSTSIASNAREIGQPTEAVGDPAVTCLAPVRIIVIVIIVVVAQSYRIQRGPNRLRIL